MKITADTNVLVRAMTGDDARQSPLARTALAGAALVALPLPVLCELVWVLSRGYGTPAADIADAIRRLMDSANVVMNRPAAEAGLAVLEAGGDFADGVITHDGRRLGADRFVSFDKKAVKVLADRGEAAGLLA